MTGPYLGRGQIGECQRCGEKVKAAVLQKDGRNPNLLVCPRCWDPKHPAETPFKPKQTEGKAKLPIAPELLPGGAGSPGEGATVIILGMPGMPGVPGFSPPTGVQPALFLTGVINTGPVVNLSWTPASTVSARVTSYEVYRNDVLIEVIPAVYDDFGGLVTALVYEDTDIEHDTSYAYEIVAISPQGSATSNEVTLSLAAPPPEPNLAELDANWVVERRSILDFGDGPIAPNSYGGNPVSFSPAANAVVLVDMLPGAYVGTFRIAGLNQVSAPITEDLVFNALTPEKYVIGAQLFSRIDSVEQLGADEPDEFYSVGYFRFQSFPGAVQQLSRVHGAFAVNSSAASFAIGNNDSGLLKEFPPSSGAFFVPTDITRPLVRHNANTTSAARMYEFNVGGPVVTLPAGDPGQVVVSATPISGSAVTLITRTGVGGVNPFVDLGYEYLVNL